MGIFYFAHLFTNSKAMNGEAAYEKAVQELHDIPFILFIEIFGIFLPLIFHSVYGVIISGESKPNVLTYKFQRNWFYLFQRITGIFLFFFIFFHVLNFRFGLIPRLNEIPVAGNAGLAYDIVSGEFAIPWIMALYILGIAATAWHLAYGFWLFAVDWGIVIGERAQKYALYACMIVGLGLLGVGINAAVSFVRPCGLFPESFCTHQAQARNMEIPNKFLIKEN